ncbi:MAG: oxygen-dependent FAD-containing oxidoreductase [Parcubacteria bacterium C7867-006]|nr:MAG: oxygen-dependent FAD-containing oxidoreductase [Parcubacteria bacterium C7867-006]
MNTEILEEIKKDFKGDVENSEEILKKYSRDASLFEIKPKLVLFPKSSSDVQNAVKWLNKNKEKEPSLSITARSAGTDMSGGPLNDSVIIDFTRYMNKIIEVKDDYGIVEPGCFYRDFDKATRKIGKIMPTYTASREICAVGGMVANNAGGEKSIKYGKTENHLKKLKVVFSDGNEYELRPMTISELEQKISENNFEGNLYKKLFDLIKENYDEIMSAKPDVSKNSSGYYLWNVYDKDNQTFDLCRLIAGSQGTLGIVTEITFNLTPIAKYSNLLVVFLPSLEKVSELVTRILPYKPESLETYDDKSMILAVRFFFDFFKQLGFWGALKLGFQFIPETFMVLSGGVPKLILMIEFSGNTEEEVISKLTEVRDHLTDFHFKMHIAKNSNEAEKYWDIRHESFNLLRKHVHGKRTAPFIDDLIVKPEFLPEFLPRIKAILDEYKLDYTVQGHLGNGNFHIIPLMDLDSPFTSDAILEISKKVYSIVKKYKGSNSAEHNDGIIRTPYLLEQFGERVNKLFAETKNIFDPKNIFNPNKKVGGTFDDIKKWMIKKN